MKRIKKLSHDGFTLIELLVATLVFSVILMLCTFGILQITRSYYKGVASTRTQQTARAAIDRISQAIQFSGGTITAPISPNGSTQAVCIGGQQFNYLLNTKFVEGTNHALVVNGGCNSSSTAQNLASASATGEELLAPNMRLAKFSITSGANNLYNITIRVVYGDDDLLSDNLKADGSPGNDGVLDSCKTPTAGSQFCAVSELSTQVEKRI